MDDRLCNLEKMGSHVQFHEPQTKVWLFDALAISTLLYGIDMGAKFLSLESFQQSL